MVFVEYIKKTIRWLWPSLIIIISSCVRKSVLESLTSEQILDGLLLYVAYLLFIIPIGNLLLRIKWLDDESKIALMILFLTLIFFEYTALFSTWWRFVGYWVKQYFYDKQNTGFILSIAIFVSGLICVQRIMDNRRKNRMILLFSTLVLSIVPFIDYLLVPNYKFDSDLFNIQQSNNSKIKAEIPKRILWIILDEHPSSLVLNEAWGYKDTVFRSGLESLGFTIYDSCVSNYNSTLFSIAATTYGEMLPIVGPQLIHAQQDSLLAERIKASPVMNYFRTRGYETHNLSFFDAGFKKYFANQGEIINSSVVGMLISKYDNQYARSQVFYNRKIIDSLCTLLNYIPDDEKRLFVYAHLLMPHGPYIPLQINDIQIKRQLFALADDHAFLTHVRYTDSTILNLLHKGLDNLSPEKKANTLLILQADHGPRYLEKGGKDLRWKSAFGILNAVHWPNNAKGRFYNGMSSVNTFRILFRDLWGYDISSLRDSSANVSPILKTED
jgi:hypothetical protein